MANAEKDSSAFKNPLRPAYRRLRGFVRENFPALYRDGTRYDAIAAEIRRLRPRTIVEIGTCRGDNAERMIRLALGYGEVDYYGFDLFEDLDGATFDKEAALWPASLEKVEARLKAVRRGGRAAGVHLTRGDTTVTLKKAAPAIGRAGLVFIDGGHSYATVRADWENSAPLCGPGAVVFFDDYPNWGVGQLVDEIDRAAWDVRILAPGDYFHHTDPPLNCRLARVTRRGAL